MKKVLALAALVGVAAFAQSTYKAPRTPDGKPDLSGVYSNASTIPLERPANLGAKEFYTDDEVKARLAKEAANAQAAAEGANDPGVHYDVSQFGLTQAFATKAANNRTSLIVGPEGRIPATLPAAQQRLAARNAANPRATSFDNPESRPLAERCITWGNVGPPMTPVGYNSDVQIFQGEGYVAVMTEMIHDVRIIPTDGRPHLPGSVKQWFGDSRGHWEGETLVVDTTNFTDKTAFRNSGDQLHVIEKFTRTDANTVLYEFTVSDPTTWEKSWTAQVPITKIDSPIYEYACQEGNYGMRNVLSGARSAEAAAAAAKK